MALFSGVQHLCTFNIVAPIIYHLLPNVWKASYNMSASIFVDVPYGPLSSMDKFTSCVAPGPSQWFCSFGKEVIIAWTHMDVQESPIASGTWGSWLQQCDSLHFHEEWWGSVPPSAVIFSWVNVIMISSRKWKKHCKGPSTTEEVNLSMLQGSQYRTSTKMDLLMVYNYFQTFGKRQ